MSVAYVPPGVTIQELSSLSVSPLLSLPGSVCLVGMSSGAIQRTDLIQLDGTTPVALPGVPSGSTMTGSSIISVMDAVNPSIAPAGYVSTVDYTFTPSTYTIARINGGAIANHSTVLVTYTYAPSDYWQPIRLNDMADIQNRFGPVWDPTGTTIATPLSHAAQIVFENGASNVVLQPLFYRNGGVPTQPDASHAAALATWQISFGNLLSLEDINIIVPIVGQSMPQVNDASQLQIEQAAQDFVYNMKTNNSVNMIAVLAEDSSTSSSVAQDATIQSNAQTIAGRYGGAVTQQIVYVNTSQFSRANAVSSFLVGGQSVAAALAGMLASRNPSATLTRQPISGFLAVTDQRTKAQKNADASVGLMVVESKGNAVQIRHAITLDNTSVVTRELNVVRGKHFVIDSVQETLDTQVIAKVVADAAAPTLVNNAVIGILEELRGLGQVSNYGNVASRITSLNPTAMEVRFSYSPIFYINYITVIFSLDITSQTITLTSVSSSTLNATT